MKPPRIDVLELSTRKIVHQVKLNSIVPSYVERVLAGLLRNMDTDKFAAVEVLK